MRRPALALAIALAAWASGCDKVKALAGKGDGGTSGGVLSFLDKDFEGEIAMQAKTKRSGGPTNMVFAIKKPKLRIDGSGGAGENAMLAQGAGIIVDPPAKKAYTLMPAMKRAMVIDLEKAKANARSMQGNVAPGGSNKPPPKITKTGATAVVAGYTCDVYDVEQGGRKTELCVADGITWFDASDMVGLGAPDLAIAAVMGGVNKFPLRMIGYDAGGAEEVRLEATKVEKKKLDDARFVVPADYQVVDMGALMQGLPSAPPPGFPSGLPSAFPPPRRR